MSVSVMASHEIRAQQNFLRQEKTTSSVRLRKRREDVTAPGRRRDRHSGDFTCSSPQREEDWSYVACPREVTRLQELRADPRRSAASLQDSRGVSSSVVNMREGRQSDSLAEGVSDRDVSEVKLRHPHDVQGGGEVKLRHPRSHSQHLSPSHHGKERSKGNTRRCSGEFEFKKVRCRSRDFSVVAPAPGQHLGKAEEQSLMERLVRGELVGTNHSGSDESGVFSTGGQESPRRPGLGRRALTQVEVRDRRRQEYCQAMAKSQEDLVKVCC